MLNQRAICYKAATTRGEAAHRASLSTEFSSNLYGKGFPWMARRNTHRDVVPGRDPDCRLRPVKCTAPVGVRFIVAVVRTYIGASHLISPAAAPTPDPPIFERQTLFQHASSSQRPGPRQALGSRSRWPSHACQAFHSKVFPNSSSTVTRWRRSPEFSVGHVISAHEPAIRMKGTP